jgi:transketolase
MAGARRISLVTCDEKTLGAPVADAGFIVHRLAVREIPRSGKPEELVERFGISASHIVDAVRLKK